MPKSPSKPLMPRQVPFSRVRPGKYPRGEVNSNPHSKSADEVAARRAYVARFDLLRAINNLAASMTKWTPECDKRVHHIMCYVYSTLKQRLVGFVGDKPCDMQPHRFGDADFAGEPETQRSTSWLHLALRGPATCFPLTGASKRQTCVSHSTPEAESLLLTSLCERPASMPNNSGTSS